jgi:serine/threonine protein kinase
MNSGELVGPYRVLEKLGEGGMGEVYRARDTRLDRDVALKVLPDSFASDPDRLMRFEREAKTLAALNHPHIAQIHGVEDAGTARALVMELVEGEDLAQRITRGPIPLDEGLPAAMRSWSRLRDPVPRRPAISPLRQSIWSQAESGGSSTEAPTHATRLRGI